MNWNLATVWGFVRCCYISSQMLACFRLTKGRATFFQLEIIVASFLHLMLLLYKVILNHTSKRQFVVLHFCAFEYFHHYCQHFLLRYLHQKISLFSNDKYFASKISSNFTIQISKYAYIKPHTFVKLVKPEHKLGGGVVNLSLDAWRCKFEAYDWPKRPMHIIGA